MNNRWTKYDTFVKKNYVNQGHATGPYEEGESIPFHCRLLVDFYHNIKTSSKSSIARQSNEKIDAQVLPRYGL